MTPYEETKMIYEIDRLRNENARQRATIERVAAVIAQNGCDCDDPTCTVPGESCESCKHEPCLAHRVARALSAGGDARG